MEAQALQLESSPCSLQLAKSLCHNEDPSTAKYKNQMCICIYKVPAALPNPREILAPALKEPTFPVGSRALLQLLGWRLLPSCECT